MKKVFSIIALGAVWAADYAARWRSPSTHGTPALSAARHVDYC